MFWMNDIACSLETWFRAAREAVESWNTDSHLTQELLDTHFPGLLNKQVKNLFVDVGRWLIDRLSANYPCLVRDAQL